jgi:hypothetical protein
LAERVIVADEDLDFDHLEITLTEARNRSLILKLVKKFRRSEVN